MKPAKLRHAVEVDQAGSFSRAAKSLNVTQSSVTKSVAEIEAELGYALFHRHARGVTTTDEAREFLDRAERILSDLDELVSDAKRGAKIGESLFRIGVSPPAVQGLLGDAILSVMDRAPSVRVHVSTGPVERMVRSLRRGDIDLLYGPSSDLPKDSYFQTVPLQPFEFSYFVRKSHPLAGADRVEYAQMREFPLITSDIFGPYTADLRKLVGIPSKGVRRGFHIIDYFPLITRLVAARDMIGAVSKTYAGSRQFRERFSVLKTDELPGLEFAVAFPVGTNKQRLITRFLDGISSDPKSIPATET